MHPPPQRPEQKPPTPKRAFPRTNDQNTRHPPWCDSHPKTLPGRADANAGFSAGPGLDLLTNAQ